MTKNIGIQSSLQRLFRQLFQILASLCLLLGSHSILAASTDSSQLLPPSTTSMMPITTPTTTALDQAGIRALLADAAKECKQDETRDYCWKRYRAIPGGTAPENTLECPGKYFAVTRFGKDALDNNGRPIIYYDSSLYQKVTRTQYPILQRLAYRCVGSTTQNTYEDRGHGTTCYLQSEGARPDSYKDITFDMPDGFIGINDPFMTQGYPERWTDAGVARCQRYTVGGCPAAWCSETVKYGYIYRWIECSRPPGYYLPIDPEEARVNNLVIPPASSEYTPAIVICSRAIAGFQPNP